MAKRQLTEEEKSQTEYTEILLADASEEDGPLDDIAMVIQRLTTRYKLSSREACIALRDYAQVLVARHMDAGMNETRQRIKELEEKLGGAR